MHTRAHIHNNNNNKLGTQVADAAVIGLILSTQRERIIKCVYYIFDVRVLGYRERPR